MSVYEWLLFLHVLSAFAAVGGLTAFWAVVAAARPGRLTVAPASIQSLARPLGLISSVGMIGVLVFGVWLAIYVDGYELWDAWILASLVLWAIAGGAGDRSGRVFTRLTETGSATDYSRGVLLHAVTTVAVLLMLVLMIFKPGA